MKKFINAICVGLGFLFLGLGVIGIALPILPTTPFFLAAAAFFAKGSKRFHKWFIGTKLYKNYIEQTIHKKEMTRKAKRNFLLTISCIFLLGIVMSPVWYAKAIILVIALGHYYYFLFRIKTAEEGESSCSTNVYYENLKTTEK